LERISFIFDAFENIHVSISGGKDSTVLAYLALMEAKKRNRKIGIFFLDEEAVYQATIDQVEYIIENISPENVIPLWLQIEFNLTNATSLTETQFIPWEAGKHKLWLRHKKDYAIKFPMWNKETQYVADKNKGFGFYDVFVNFERCYKNTAFLVGLRGTESPNRWRTVSKNPALIAGKQIYWATTKGSNFSMYPLYDWNFSDIWRYIHENNIRYHKIYDYQVKKGYPITEMRISSLIHEKSFKSLVDLPEFEPETYNKLLKRAKGISLAQETGKNAKLFKARKLPKNYKSWRSYRDFLIQTHPDQIGKEILARRFSKHLDNEYVARQQVRQLILNDYENNLPVDNKPDPREVWIKYYMENL
jgi:predicted phosphoadenosine phosphosulfate sulfurtransferase